ncbi:MAG TPA: hypothetical protein VHR72_01300 [Gemmataceae bacterium]|jgi:hypothetical protein|nr:hypothetical protein [Gemmataceae bacterium]
MSRRSLVSLALAVMASGLLVPNVSAQAESKSAQATRKKLLQTIDAYDEKDIGTKDFLSDILKNQVDKEIRFTIDNGSGVSNNSKLSMKFKNYTVEKVLNEFSDKMDCGWFVESNVGNNMKDGRVVIRKNSKGKERGYEFGKEPKKKASAPVQERRESPAGPIVEAAHRKVILTAKRE